MRAFMLSWGMLPRGMLPRDQRQKVLQDIWRRAPLQPLPLRLKNLHRAELLVKLWRGVGRPHEIRRGAGPGGGGRGKPKKNAGAGGGGRWGGGVPHGRKREK